MKKPFKLLSAAKLVIGAVLLVSVFAGYGVVPVKAGVPVDCTVGRCGGACEEWQKCKSSASGNYCDNDASCGPTPTKAKAATPTPVPIGGGGGGSTNITPTNTPAPTWDPNCVANPGTVVAGNGCTTASDCPSSTSSISCVNGQCHYTGNLKSCPSGSSCPSYWVPGGWGCSAPQNTLSNLQVQINPNNESDNDRYDVKMSVVVSAPNNPNPGKCEPRLDFNIGPDPNSTSWSKGCVGLWSGANPWTCTASGGNDNRGARNDWDTWEYHGGQICVNAHLKWVRSNGVPDTVPCVGRDPDITTCITPACKVTSANVSTAPMCLSDIATNTVPYVLNWSVDNPSSADHLTAYYIGENDSFIPDGFNPANPLSTSTRTTSINLPPKNGGYGFYVCCSGGSKPGDYNCGYAGSSDNWIYADSGAPEPPTFASDSPNYSAADNTVTFHWSWEGDHANCSSGICSDHEGPVNYCINGQPGGSYSPMCTNCYAPYYWQVVVDGTGNTLQNNNNAQSSVTQSCSGHEGQTLRLDVRSKDARGNASSFVSQSYVCPTATPTPTLPNPTPTSIWVTPTPTPASVHCSAASVRDATGQPVTQVVGNVGDSYSLTYTLDDYSTDWTPGIRYQFNELTGGSASTFCSSGTNSCTLTGTIGAGQDSVWFFANLKKDLDPDGDGVYDTYRCRWNGTWSNPPGAPPNTTGGCVNTCELKIPFVTPTPTATPTPTPQSCLNGSECPGGICTSGICGTPTPTLVPKQPTPPPPTLVTV